MDAAAAWDALAPPWRRCLELAWESWRAGSIGVGAMITTPGGGTLAEGRSGWFEEHRGGVAGSKISHAETAALAGVPAGHDLAGHILWTSLEPCVLCAGALVIAHVPEVRFMGADPLTRGVERLPELNDYVASRWPERRGPLPGPYGVFATALPVARFVAEFASRDGESKALAALRAHGPRVASLAEDLAAADLGDSLAAVLDGWWPRLETAAG